MRKSIALLLVVALLAIGPGMVLGAEGPGGPHSENVLASLENLREAARAQYSGEEISALAREMARIRQEERGLVPIDPERIVSRNAQFKFDTPPVIKDGRILIPVRALTAAFGATVDWDQEDRIVTIVKEDVEMTIMTIYLEDGTAEVDGDPVELDVPPMLMGGRTVMPLRFILEAMGFEVDYHADGTVEID